MKNQILIGDFVKLTNSTLKTVLYYHKIGLLNEPKRSNSGYRLYGAEELNQMRMIKHLKNLGLDLKKIKEILGHAQDNKNITEVLKSLYCELLTERKKIDEQISKIETLLNKQVEDVEETLFESSSFRAITETLDQDQFENYKKSHEELFNQQRNIFGVMDDFQWGKSYKENFSEMAKYFKLNPKKHEIALELGNRLSKLKYMEVDDSEIEKLAKEGRSANLGGGAEVDGFNKTLTSLNVHVSPDDMTKVVIFGLAIIIVSVLIASITLLSNQPKDLLMGDNSK